MNKASKIVIFGDGGSRGNPGPAAYGFVISDDNKAIIYEEGKTIGVDTNNVAEYHAVIKALEWVIISMPEVKEIEFNLDSLLVASQMSGNYKVKHPKMKELFITAKGLEAKLEAKIIYNAIRRHLNKEADKLVNDALDGKI